MGHGDYALNEFAQRLAEVESRFAKELHAVIECFVQSRVDLPVKHLEDISKSHSKRAKNLKKAVDQKKSDGVNLWKITNIYSATCVDQDDAMREIRVALRKHIKKETMKIRMNGEDVNSYRRVADDYRPLITQQPVFTKTAPSIPIPTPPRDPSPPLTAEIYDQNPAMSAEDKERWLEMWRAQVEKEDREREEVRRKLEKRQSMKIFGNTVNLGNSIANLNLNISKFFGEKKSATTATTNGLGVVSPHPDPRDAQQTETGIVKPHHEQTAEQTPPLAVDDSKLVMKF